MYNNFKMLEEKIKKETLNLELWEVIDLVVLDKGEEELGKLSQYGMECALNNYQSGIFERNAHNFYSNNFIYFVGYHNQKNLFENKQRFNKEINSGKIRL